MIKGWIYYYYFLVFCFIFLKSTSLVAQNAHSNNVKVIYQLEWLKFKDSKKLSTEFATLLINSKSGIFTWNEMFELESLRRHRNVTEIELLTYDIPPNFVIQFTANQLLYREVVGNQLVQYKEMQKLKWTFEKESKTILGYHCKMATTSYGGRNWIAWYAPDLPFSFGPYKFHGLPGLILEVNDDNHTFVYTAKGLERSKLTINKNLNQYFLLSESDIQTTTRGELNALRARFESMTFNERLNFMNGDQSGNYSVVTFSDNGEQVELKQRPRKKNYIEIDY